MLTYVGIVVFVNHDSTYLILYDQYLYKQKYLCKSLSTTTVPENYFK